jgi:hypothetical protein
LRIEATLTENIHELFSKLELELPEALLDELLSDKPAAPAATAGSGLDADTN